MKDSSAASGSGEESETTWLSTESNILLSPSLAKGSFLKLAVSEAGESGWPLAKAIAIEGSEVDGITMLVAM